jgi:hypothetical protein
MTGKSEREAVEASVAFYFYFSFSFYFPSPDETDWSSFPQSLSCHLYMLQLHSTWPISPVFDFLCCLINPPCIFALTFFFCPRLLQYLISSDRTISMLSVLCCRIFCLPPSRARQNLSLVRENSNGRLESSLSFRFFIFLQSTSSLMSSVFCYLFPSCILEDAASWFLCCE